MKNGKNVFDNLTDSVTSQFEQNNVEAAEQEKTKHFYNSGNEKENTNIQKPQSNLILGKFKTVDDLISAYQNSERLISKTRQELKEAKKEFLKAESENGKIGDEPPLADDFENLISLDDKSLENLDSENNLGIKATENPPISNEKLAYIVDFLFKMGQGKQNLNGSKEQSLENNNQDKPEDFGKLIEDEGFVEKLLLQNPVFKKTVTKSVLKNVMEFEPPTVINGGGGYILSTIQNKPKTFEEAGNAFLNMLKKLE